MKKECREICKNFQQGIKMKLAKLKIKTKLISFRINQGSKNKHRENKGNNKIKNRKRQIFKKSKRQSNLNCRYLNSQKIKNNNNQINQYKVYF